MATAPLSTSCDSLLTFEAENMKTVPLTAEAVPHIMGVVKMCMSAGSFHAALRASPKSSSEEAESSVNLAALSEAS